MSALKKKIISLKIALARMLKINKFGVSNMSDEESCEQGFGVHSKKEIIGVLTYYTVSYFLTILVPNLIAAAIGMKTLAKGCGEIRDTCNLYEDDEDESLQGSVSGLASLFRHHSFCLYEHDYCFCSSYNDCFCSKDHISKSIHEN